MAEVTGGTISRQRIHVSRGSCVLICRCRGQAMWKLYLLSYCCPAGLSYCYSLGRIREHGSAHHLLVMFLFMCGCESPRLVRPSNWAGQVPGFFLSIWSERGHTQGTRCDHRVRERRITAGRHSEHQTARSMKPVMVHDDRVRSMVVPPSGKGERGEVEGLGTNTGRFV